MALSFVWFGLFPARAASLRLARLAVYDITNIDPTMGEYLMHVLARRGRRSVRGLLGRHRGAAMPLIREQLARITTPTLVIWGAEDRFFNVTVGKAASEHTPGAQLHVIPRAGHVPFFDQRAELNAVLIRFLRGD
ncbi:MAG: alpha/beta fold hydrolase [Anaerolineales bacterium]|nr:MAG: alpha/beta fold hydrolase [Anaerolineales bacterium]